MVGVSWAGCIDGGRKLGRIEWADAAFSDGGIGLDKVCVVMYDYM